MSNVECDNRTPSNDVQPSKGHRLYVMAWCLLLISLSAYFGVSLSLHTHIDGDHLVYDAYIPLMYGLSIKPFALGVTSFVLGLATLIAYAKDDFDRYFYSVCLFLVSAILSGILSWYGACLSYNGTPLLNAENCIGCFGYAFSAFSVVIVLYFSSSNEKCSSAPPVNSPTIEI
ncbi:hypothetical protein [Nitrospirillum amazonense]|uniref:hypothetical protein n=1 Tax=Nitrospirillum amazonense TaxID=28077 RepID=UPI002412BF4F|nr:hypothetical protein [Nitrospirillum amazonense]MDG3444593.1 hypothetical protein [Nitrospirillum amazonense]